MNDEKVLEKVKDWFQTKVVGTTVFYELPTDDGKRIKSYIYSAGKIPSEYLLEKPWEQKSWLTVHEVSAFICDINARKKDSALVSVEVILLKTKGDKEGEGESYREGATYYLRVFDNDIDDVSEDFA